MALSSITALRRAPLTLAKFWRILPKFVVTTCNVLLNLVADKRQFYPPLTDRQARDIGIHTADLEFQRLRLPSQHTHHPHG